MNDDITLKAILYGVLLALPLLLFALWKKRGDKEPSAEEDVHHEDTALESPNDRFFDALDAGAEVIPLVRTYRQQDKYLIQSILDSHGIPSFLSSQYVNNLLPGIVIKGHTDSTISIDRNDTVAATVFVLEYIDSMIDGHGGRKRSIAEAAYNALAFLHALPTTRGSEYPELLIDLDEMLEKIEDYLDTESGD